MHGELGEGGQEVQTPFVIKIRKSWRCNVQRGDYRQLYCVVIFESG